VLELGHDRIARLGPDIMDEPPELDAIVARMRASDPGRAIGDAILDQGLVAGIGNMWKAEALFRAQVSPWRALKDVTDGELRAIVMAAHELMTGPRKRHAVYRRPGRPCGRCGATIVSRPQGDAVRMAYWCPQCQA
jgi:endonuclease-8